MQVVTVEVPELGTAPIWSTTATTHSWSTRPGT